MRDRITQSYNHYPSLQDSVRAAHEALEKGGSVKLGRRGDLVMTGGTFRGRVVRYFKIRFFQDTVRRQNHAVIAALNNKVCMEFGTERQLKIKATVTSTESYKRFLKSIIHAVSDLRAATEYAPADSIEEEIRNAVKFGFAGSIAAQKSGQGAPGSPIGATVTAKEQLFWYNRTMHELFDRYPELRDLPAITSLDLDVPVKNEGPACYLKSSQTMMLYSHPVPKVSKEMLLSHESGYLTPKQDFSGLIHHEYAHHLSRRVVPEKQWIPKLLDALKSGGMTKARIKRVGGKPTFDQQTAARIATSVSEYAAVDTLECAAEILSWYMNPEYGKSVKRMPEHLENWVRECFPMLTTD